MPLTFAVNQNNDIYIGPDGNLVLISGINAILQACEQAAKTQLGEMVLETNQGIPNFQTVWVGTPNLQQWEAALRLALQNVPGVIGIKSIAFSTQNGVLSYNAVIETDEGIGAINGGF